MLKLMVQHPLIMEMIHMHRHSKRVESFMSGAHALCVTAMKFQSSCYLAGMFACARIVQHALMHALFAVPPSRPLS
jgi:hypothetical protein